MQINGVICSLAAYCEQTSINLGILKCNDFIRNQHETGWYLFLVTLSRDDQTTVCSVTAKLDSLNLTERKKCEEIC
jgi:hypothetical protein